MPQHTAGAARPTPVAVVNGVAEKADLSLQCHFGHGREPAAAPRLPTPRERAVARWNALVHPHPQVIDEEREIAFGRRAGAKYEPSVSISFLCRASTTEVALFRRPISDAPPSNKQPSPRFPTPLSG